MDMSRLMVSLSSPDAIQGATKADDGVFYCDTCGKPRSCVVNYQGRDYTMPCSCDCHPVFDAKAEEKQREEDKRKAAAFVDSQSLKRTFSSDDGKFGPEQMETCRKWIEKLPKGLENPDYPHGLLLFGAPDAGKTFAATCIANAALDKGMKVISRSVPWLLAQDIDERPAIIQQMISAELLVLDDLGAERGTDYAKEIVYTVIDERYKNGALTVVTTNLSNQELANAADLRDRRSYNRLLEFCLPLRFDTGRKRFTATSIAAMKAAINS